MFSIKESMSLSLVGNIKREMQLNRFKKRWRKTNQKNYTIPINLFPIQCVRVGDFSYGDLNVVTFSVHHILTVGRFVSIAGNTTFLLDTEHYFNNVSTYPFKVKMLQTQTSESFGKGDIIVDDDVWIGYGATIMSGVHIGQGAVVAAGAVVTKDIPPYAIVGGVPAKVIKYRFEQGMIEELLKIDYGKLSKDDVERHIQELYEPLKDKSQLDWMPKK